MDALSYLSVLLSIIIGLAITQILKRARGVVLARAHVVPYWPSFVLAGFLLALALRSWRGDFGLREWCHKILAALIPASFVVFIALLYVQLR
jgi:hypothetical protein